MPTPPETPELAPGAALQGGRFVIDEVLGRGGFGITYAAVDQRLQRAIAIKELFPGATARLGGVVTPPAHEAAAFTDAKERFLREATVLARFNHAGIVRVYEVFEAAGTAYLVMELLHGSTLHDLLVDRRAPLTEHEALGLAARCGEALEVVHADGVLHRDLNPANVMIAGQRVVLIDFGLAREFVTDETAAMTRLVTPGYAPPEQYAGTGRFGPPTDVYGLAATLYRALAGSAPTPALDRQVGARLEPLHRRNPAVSKLVSDAIADGLELDPAHRPQSIAQFLSRLGPRAPLDPAGFVPPSTAAAAPPHVPAGLAAPSAGVPPVFRPGPPIDHDGTVADHTTPRAEPEWSVAARPTDGPPPVPALLAELPTTAPGAWKAHVPALAFVASIGAAAPVLGLVVLAVVVLPALATAGDLIVFTRLRRYGDRLRWKHRVALPAYVPMRLARNVAAVAAVAVPSVVLTAGVVAVALMVDGTSSATTINDWVLRPGGAVAALLVAVPVLRDRSRFRAPIVGERLRRLVVDDAGRLLPAGWVAWVVAGFVAAGAIALRPDLWPLG